MKTKATCVAALGREPEAAEKSAAFCRDAATPPAARYMQWRESIEPELAAKRVRVPGEDERGVYINKPVARGKRVRPWKRDRRNKNT